MASESENDAYEYLFRQVRDGVFVRKCYGLEELASNMEEHCDGFTHLTSTAAVSIPSAPPLQDGDSDPVEAYIHNAWVAFRHYTPAIACKTFRLPDGDQRFAFRYTVPRSEEDVRAWVVETVFFAVDEKGMYERHCELKDGRWWRCSDDHYIAELHVSRGAAPDDWLFSMVFSHNSIDGRNAFAMLDLFFKFLRAELEGSAGPVSSIEWGPEAVRLPPPGAFTMALAESGSPPDIAPPKPEVVSPQQVHEEVIEESPPALIPWLYTPRQTGRVGDVSRLVTFSEATTARLHAACRQRGYTITQAVTALSALAHAEAALRAASDLGAERFGEVSGAFEAATHYLVAWNFINHRHKFTGGYDSYESPRSSALCTADGVPLFLSMDGIRSCIELGETLSVKRTVNEDTFWDILVRGVADAWKATDTSLEGYTERSLVNHHSISTFNPHMFDVPALIVSSIGDLGRLNILQGGSSSLAVKDVICGIRVRTAPVMNLLWEYEGRISCHFMSAGEHMTCSELERVTRLYEEWSDALY